MSEFYKIPEDFRKLADGLQVSDMNLDSNDLDKPVYWLWVHDPHEDKIILEHNKDKHHADHVDHTDLAKRVPHPDRTHGYAYRIKGGFRITDYDHKDVSDPHIKKLVEKKLNDS